MKALVVGGGGREHALAWKLAQSARVDQVYVAPGNAGTAREDKVVNVDIGAEDIPALLNFAREQEIALTIVGPEAPLVAGIIDEFEKAGLRCFGPRQNAAVLEGSKAFSKDFLKRHNIPTARYQSFTDLLPALAYLTDHALPIVIKADGLAAGKGVVIANTLDQAQTAVRDMLEGGSFGEAGRRIVVEEFLQGEEASFMLVTDGTAVQLLPSSQDHKRRDDGDRGPNTGGMGAYSPAPVVTPALSERVMAEIVHPTLRGMAAEGRPYQGFLYVGLMITPQGDPKVVEFNCRLGDPEAEVILMRLQSDLADLCEAALEDRLANAIPQWDPRIALGVVLASGGYPGSYAKGQPISGLENENINKNNKILHCGTANQDGAIVANGGRVLCVCALGETVRDAQQEAYARVAAVNWDGMFYRRDIGYRAIRFQKQLRNL
jgi:phosphoribosylamine--glycine ligase